MIITYKEIIQQKINLLENESNVNTYFTFPPDLQMIFSHHNLLNIFHSYSRNLL